VIVNIGAYWPSGQDRPGAINWDGAWEVFRSHPQYSAVGFELDERRFASTYKHIQRAGLANRTLLLKEAVHPRTICSQLRGALSMLRTMQRAGSLNPTGPLSLVKIDIDSLDLPVVRALCDCGYMPRAVLVEHNQFVPPFVQFSALPQLSHQAPEALEPRYIIESPASRYWACSGASLAAWSAQFGATYGYELVSALDNNALFVRRRHGGVKDRKGGERWLGGREGLTARAAHRLCPPRSKDIKACKRGLDSGSSVDSLARTVMQIDVRCNRSSVPYFLRLGRHCCPAQALHATTAASARSGDADLLRSLWQSIGVEGEVVPDYCRKANLTQERCRKFGVSLATPQWENAQVDPSALPRPADHPTSALCRCELPAWDGRVGP